MREGLKDLQSSANECLRTQPHQQDSRAGKPRWHQALFGETNTGNMPCSGAQSITDIVGHCPETGMTKPHSFGIFIILLPMFLKALTRPSQQQGRSSRVLTRGQFISPTSVMQVAPGQLMPQGTWTFCSPWGETDTPCVSFPSPSKWTSKVRRDVSLRLRSVGMASLSPSGKTGVSILSHRFQAWPQPTCTEHSYRLNQCDHLICCLLSSFPRSYDLLPAYPSSRWWCPSVVVWAASCHWGGETGPVCFSEASPTLQTGKCDAQLADACSASWCALPCCTAQSPAESTSL